MSTRSQEYVVRFSARQRVEHLLVMLLFLTLAVTGFPQKFYDAAWAQPLVDAFGGLQAMRWVHRVSGLAFCALAAVHIGAMVLGALRGRVPLSLVPTRKDFTDAVTMLRYYLRLSDRKARFDRFDYKEKFEYWGLVMGAVVMSATGLILYFPLLATRLLPGELIPVAKVAHSNEGLMAFLVVITWHVYNAHLAPEVFPFNTTIFTGKISTARLEEDHALEYERLFPPERHLQVVPKPEPAAAAPGEAPPEKVAAGGR